MEEKRIAPNGDKWTRQQFQERYGSNIQWEASPSVNFARRFSVIAGECLQAQDKKHETTTTQPSPFETMFNFRNTSMNNSRKSASFSSFGQQPGRSMSLKHLSLSDVNLEFRDVPFFARGDRVIHTLHRNSGVVYETNYPNYSHQNYTYDVKFGSDCFLYNVPENLLILEPFNCIQRYLQKNLSLHQYCRSLFSQLFVFAIGFGLASRMFTDVNIVEVLEEITSKNPVFLVPDKCLLTENIILLDNVFSLETLFGKCFQIVNIIFACPAGVG